MLLKSIMKSVKYLVGLIPSDLKTKLSRNPYLMSWYSRALNRSGLFYGEPCPVDMQKLYKKYLCRQASALESIDNPLIDTTFVFIITSVENIDALHHSISSLKKLEAECIEVVLCIQNHVLNDKASNIYNSAQSKFNCQINNHHFLSDFFAGNQLALSKPGIFINAGDRLNPKSLLAFSQFHHLHECDYAYCDVDLFDEVGNLSSPYFKPDWNPDLQLSTEYIETGLWSLNPQNVTLDFTDDMPISQWLTRQYLSNKSFSLSHLPRTLVNSKSHGCKRLKKELPASILAEMFLHENKQIRSVKWNHTKPLVSIIIPTKNAKDLVETCINSILHSTTYNNIEILLVDNNSEDAASLAYFEVLSSHPQITVLKYPYAFNYSAINNFAAEKANGEVIALVNNDIEVISEDWLDYMVGHVMRSDVGCVGAKLLYPDNKIQHAGVVMGYGGGAGHAHKFYPIHHNGYMNRLGATQNFSAVTAACLLVRKSVWQSVNGLNEEDLTVAFNDVDFCLKVVNLGLRNIYCAEAVLFHHESVSRGIEDTPEKQKRFLSELTYLQTQWGDFIENDPAYNENLSLSRENFALKE